MILNFFLQMNRMLHLDESLGRDIRSFSSTYCLPLAEQHQFLQVQDISSSQGNASFVEPLYELLHIQRSLAP